MPLSAARNIGACFVYVLLVRLRKESVFAKAPDDANNIEKGDLVMVGDEIGHVENICLMCKSEDAFQMISTMHPDMRVVTDAWHHNWPRKEVT